MPYLIILKHDGKHWLELTKNDENIAIAAYETPDATIKQFSHFKREMMSGSYERHTSAGMGIVFLSPEAILWNGTAEEIKEFVIDDRPVRLQGLGYRTGPVVQIDPKIMMGRESIRISSHIVNGAYRDIGYKTYEDDQKQTKLWEK